MDSLYPNLQARFKSEGLCPICLMEMELAPRYVCINQHTICHRCKPYYYNCPSCHSPLEMQMPSPNTSYVPPPPIHFLPHSLPTKFHGPTAPPMDEFQAHERGWRPPTPTENQELRACRYAHLGCWVKVPIRLADLHESRCQFRPHLEEENLPTDMAHKHDDLVECTYRVVGCKVKTSPWRISIHEQHCIYKDRFNERNISDSLRKTTISSNDDFGDPKELVECKYRKYGCMVNMPRRLKLMHQEKCNYREYHDGRHDSSSEYDPDQQVPCKWTEYGCRVKPKRSLLEIHVEKCNYRMENCAYRNYGCTAIIHPAAKYAHERNCEFAN
ncbi:TNF receptor-associated factor family protein DDB_G0290883-like [Ceratina calcarata]|uniref:TNF receptor-associated factor family protein DDB_G0290883-like n=1 Tax=Ceratina calcarata TaxID=156304 RepID=A0AAJ7JDW4_9HYME|nr:TNF receptor-associated factor family protein DDB_G0290883-like [Ceratina calcarata]